MKPLAFTKLRVYKNLRSLFEAIPPMKIQELPISCSEMIADLSENREQSFALIKAACREIKSVNLFLNNIEELILYNADLQVLFDHCYSEELFSKELYQKLSEQRNEIRELEIGIFNKAKDYFDSGVVPQGWV